MNNQHEYVPTRQWMIARARYVKRTGATVQQIADKLGLSKSAVQRYTNGSRRARVWMIEALAV